MQIIFFSRSRLRDTAILVLALAMLGTGQEGYAQGKSGNAGGHGAANAASHSGGASESRGANGNGAHGQSDHSQNASGQRGGPNGPAFASVLKGLNAYHANPKAFENAAKDSQVGRIATYVNAVKASDDLYQQWTVAYNAYSQLEGSYDGRSGDEIMADIDALDPDADSYAEDLTSLEAELDALNDYETELAALRETSNEMGAAYQDAEAEQDTALSEATGGRTLTDEEEKQINDLISSR